MRYILFIIIICTACNAQNKDTNNNPNRIKAREINNKASGIVRLVAENQELNSDSLYLYGISQFEIAIQLDSSISPPYVNKLNFLVYLKQYEKAIRWIDTMKKCFPSNKECVIYQGFLYEKIGKIDSAFIIFNNLKQMYVQNVRNNPDDLKSKIKIVEIEYYITNDREKVLKQIDELLKEFPDNWELKSCKDILQFFNKEDLFQ